MPRGRNGVFSFLFLDFRQAEKLASSKVTTSDLKELCVVLGLERGGTKDELSKRIVDFLECPEEGSLKGKRKSSGKRKLFIYFFRLQPRCSSKTGQRSSKFIARLISACCVR
jgi:hypothetical protein